MSIKLCRDSKGGRLQLHSKGEGEICLMEVQMREGTISQGMDF